MKHPMRALGGPEVGLQVHRRANLPKNHYYPIVNITRQILTYNVNIEILATTE